MPALTPAPTEAQVEQFIVDGFLRLDHAFPEQLADECRAILWADTGCDPDDRSTWTRPVIRLGHYFQPPFRAAANTPALHAAFDRLVGRGRWQPPFGLGTLPVRFPAPDDPGDAGWHVDPGFGWEQHPDDFLAWRSNIGSRGRALLMLFLLSEVGERDAPTRIRVGSHRAIARRLAPFGEAGLSLRELVADDFAGTAACREVVATGGPGTVYLCHPFLVHAAQRHRGERPRFMAQPPLLPTGPLRLGPDDDASPVEQAIVRACAP